MPSPYELKTRWLEWHERWPVPEIESLKRQIDAIRREIFLLSELTDAPEVRKRIEHLYEVLATLERMMPPF